MNRIRNYLGRLGEATLPVLFIIAMVVALLMPAPASGQGAGGWDCYAVPRVFTWIPQVFTNHSGTLTASNSPIDLHGCDGIAALYLGTTNYAGNAGSPLICARLFGSQDNTNWYLMTNVSQAIATSYPITNMAGGTYTTNLYMLPGTLTTPTAATAGFASTYLTPTPFTNAGIICTNVTWTNAWVGWSVSDGPRYVQVQYIVTGTDVGYMVSPVVIARRKAGDVFY